ncbi:hypothetical protein PILCRDRAFT_292387 [Piloderma croceum F 1598]|uniref:Uncharacterized protein n=1 Tax=Piloderma croceum (strain F 1598) TaxID=765440 RepID=A0A0C3CB33_PILCF|nr:hypothetical protein PILCRDRAFT_292387 [Piloderma croceum F 1598]
MRPHRKILAAFSSPPWQNRPLYCGFNARTVSLFALHPIHDLAHSFVNRGIGRILSYLGTLVSAVMINKHRLSLSYVLLSPRHNVSPGTGNVGVALKNKSPCDERYIRW